MNKKLAIIGLGYVGLPLALEFGKKRPTIGYDISKDRINELMTGFDRSGESEPKDIKLARNLIFTSNLKDVSDCDIYIISVPTPIDKNNNPDLSILKSVTIDIGGILNKGDIVIYESTVYPGCTDEVCVPLLEKQSGLKYNKDFFCGYSPERINPGDKDRTLTKIIKVTSGSNKEIAKYIDNLYKSIITEGTCPVSSIKIAEAAKIIENCQRDINIAFVNELSILFNKMGIDSTEVLNAAGTKWNFLPFSPGLVGGHCIGVDPYYLTHKAKEIGYNSKIILSGRKLNDSMPKIIVDNIYKYFNNKQKKIKILILGLTFKENCPDTRNSKVIDIYEQFKKAKHYIDIYDPVANKKDVYKHFKIKLIEQNMIKDNYYNCILIAVAHDVFKKINISKYQSINNSLVYDLKNVFNNKEYMRL